MRDEAPSCFLAALTLDASAAAALGLPERRLELCRAWPRGGGQMLVEYRAPGGATVAGQWLGGPDGRPDRERLERVARRTRVAADGRGGVVVLEGEGLLLQAGGADARLPALAELLRQPGATLVSHRPERRGVVRLSDGERVSYAKVVRPEAVRRLLDAAGWSAGLAAAGVAVPGLVGADPAQGLTLWSSVRGRALFALLGDETLVDASARAGAALRTMHALTPPGGLPAHRAADEARVLRGWLGRLLAFAHAPAGPALGLSAAAAAAAPAVLGALAAGAGAGSAMRASALVHRDLHDKQVLVSSSGTVGLIDLDTLAVGEPALDLASLVVHLELRALQGLVPPKKASAAARAAVTAYAPMPAVVGRLGAYADATRLRLACVYSFRPRWQGCPPALLQRLGTPCPGLAVR